MQHSSTSLETKLTTDLYKAFASSSERDMAARTHQSDEKSIPEYRFNSRRIANEFLRLWFFENRFDNENTGNYGSFYFLHHKNASVTDIVFSEIKALLQYHFHDNLNKQTNVIFYDTNQIRSICENLFQSLVSREALYSKEEYDEKVRLVVSLIIDSHTDMFRQAVIIDHYFTSTVVHIPPSLSLNIDKVVAESGYIHSAGTLLYIRRMDKAWSEDIERQLNKYLDQFANNDTGKFDGKPINFIPYAKEFFDEYEPMESSASTRNGLDGVKLSIAKQHVGSFSMNDFILWLAKKYEGKLVFPVGNKSYKAERDEHDTNSEQTLWILSDYEKLYSMESQKYYQGNARYLIIYAQRIRNHSQLITYKERKPAWYAPVTIPSTLSAALINISRTGRRGKSKLRILDPFCGTGTFLMDAALRYEDAVIVGMDKNPYVHNVVGDNIAYFGGGADFRDAYDGLFEVFGLNELDCSEFSLDAIDIKSVLQTEFFQTLFSPNSRNIDNMVDVIREIINSEFDDVFFSDFFANLDYVPRLWFYAQWRAICSNQYILSKSKDGLRVAILSELKKLKLETKSYASLLSMQALGQSSSFSYGVGSYSTTSFVNPEYMRDMKERLVCTSKVSDVNKFLSKNEAGICILNCNDSIEALEKIKKKFDIIITDPPYGVNTSEGGADRLFSLFDRLTKSLATKLTKGGELILTLPEFTRNGQQIPFYQTSNFVDPSIRTILAKASHDHGTYTTREHYWSSPSVLDRTMTYVRIR